MAYSSDIGDIKSIEKLIDGVHTFIWMACILLMRNWKDF